MKAEEVAGGAPEKGEVLLGEMGEELKEVDCGGDGREAGGELQRLRFPSIVNVRFMRMRL